MSTSMSATSQKNNILTFTLPQPCASICLELPISTPRIFCVAEAVKLHSPSGCPMKAGSDSRSSALGATRLLQYWMLSCKGSEGLGQRPGVTMFPVLLLHFWSGSKPACVRLSCTNPCKSVKIQTKFNSLQDALKQVYDSVLLNVLPTMDFWAVFLCSFCHRVNGRFTALSLATNNQPNWLLLRHGNLEYLGTDSQLVFLIFEQLWRPGPATSGHIDT